MTSRESPAERIGRQARDCVTTTIEEIRRARIGAGMSQGVLGAHSGISRSRVSRIERGKESSVPADLLIKLAAWVGLNLPMRLFPGADPIRDAAHLRLLGRLWARLGESWTWKSEVPLPVVGDQRAWDAVGRHGTTGLILHVEAETRLGDIQALLRRLALKRRDGMANRLVLVVADTRHNRESRRAAATGLATAFPADSRPALRCILDGQDPGADVLLAI